MILPILAGYVAPFKPVANITPFTHRDGFTYLEILEELRTYVNTDLVEFINTNFTNLGDQFETQVNELITNLNSSIDSGLTDKINDAITQINDVVTTGTQELTQQIDDQKTATDSQLATQNTNITNQLIEQNSNVSEQLATQDTKVTNQLNAQNALVAAAFNTVTLESFVQIGEDITNPVTFTTVMQRAVDALNTQYLADGAPRQIDFKDGTYTLAKAGTQNTVNYSIHWKSGVGIHSSSKRGVIFKAAADSTPFFAGYDWGNLKDIHVGAHVLDCSAQTNPTYTTQLKGWFIQGLTDSSFDDIYIKDSWATGFGCDFLVRTTVTGEVSGAGRGIKVLGIDPNTVSGGSGFGIGTGRFETEDFTLDVVTRNCGYHGVFTEKQSSATYYSRGARITVKDTGSYISFKDAGCDGLIATVDSLSAQYAGVAHMGTILSPVAGINGSVVANIRYATTGLMFGNAQGNYTFDVDINSASIAAVSVPTSVDIGSRISLTGRISNNGFGIKILSGTRDLNINDLTCFGNSGNDIALLGAGNAAIGVGITNCDCRSAGIIIEQNLDGEYFIANNRGIATSSVSNLTATSNSPSSITLIWAAPAIAVTDYAIEFRKVGTLEWSTFNHAPSTATTATINALTAQQSYEFRVAPITADGNFSYSNSVIAVPSSPPKFLDTFTSADIDNLNGRYASEGTDPVAWVAATPTSLIGIRSNRATATTFTAAVAGYAYIETNSPDGDVRATLGATRTDTAGLDDSTGIVFRYVDTSNFWRVGVVGAGNHNWKLQKIVAGASTDVGPIGPLVSVGDIVEVRFHGSTIAWRVNGNIISTNVDPDLATATKVGIRGQANVDTVSGYNEFAYYTDAVW